MIYLYDLIFVVVFLLNKTKYMQEKNCDVSRYYYWIEAVFILLYLFLRPCHEFAQKFVSTYMMLAVMLLWYLFYYKKIKKI